MPESISRVLSRIRQIQSLIGDPPPPNEVFGKELQRSVDGMNASSRNSSRAGSSGLDPGLPSEMRLPDGLMSGSAADVPASLAPLIGEAASETGLPKALISAVMETESGYHPEAVSPAGALGLMQLMPGTARSVGVQDPLDPRENVLGGARYLRQQLTRFGSVEKALAAYNAGPKAVEQYGGIPPFRETQSYVRRVLQSIRRLTSRRE